VDVICFYQYVVPTGLFDMVAIGFIA